MITVDNKFIVMLLTTEKAHYSSRLELTSVAWWCMKRRRRIAFPPKFLLK